MTGITIFLVPRVDDGIPALSGASGIPEFDEPSPNSRRLLPAEGSRWSREQGAGFHFAFEPPFNHPSRTTLRISPERLRACGTTLTVLTPSADERNAPRALQRTRKAKSAPAEYATRTKAPLTIPQNTLLIYYSLRRSARVPVCYWFTSTRKNPFVLPMLPTNVLNGGVAAMLVAIRSYAAGTSDALQIEYVVPSKLAHRITKWVPSV